ncbi:hypothetical protein NLG97_g3985 [Lecanicillium saksenae]|uniref:Uncharacterized protein n=1 Tax=Lecanicillium saksenae TaxID=468837 RepID=A0ACC1QWS9_9HYPO|nr:hypothetical protein NLG97_g3985 [Lecanicillium saksenae]
MIFTTPEELQDSIDSAEVSDKIRNLKLFFSGLITGISFHVPSHFRQLQVLRCVPKRYSGHLLIDGKSTYHETRLDKWQAHRHKHHELVIGHSRGCRANFTEEEQEELKSHFQGFQAKPGRTNWNDVKGRVAAILGLAVGSVKFALGFKAVAGGVYLKYAFGLHSLELGMAGAKVASVATVAGSAVVLGVGVAAAVYFVPWGALFTWLQRKFSWM